MYVTYLTKDENVNLHLRTLDSSILTFRNTGICPKVLVSAIYFLVQSKSFYGHSQQKIACYLHQSVWLSVCPSACKNSRTAKLIQWNFIMGDFTQIMGHVPILVKIEKTIRNTLMETYTRSCAQKWLRRIPAWGVHSRDMPSQPRNHVEESLKTSSSSQTGAIYPTHAMQTTLPSLVPFAKVKFCRSRQNCYVTRTFPNLFSTTSTICNIQPSSGNSNLIPT